MKKTLKALIFISAEAVIAAAFILVVKILLTHNKLIAAFVIAVSMMIAFGLLMYIANRKNKKVFSSSDEKISENEDVSKEKENNSLLQKKEKYSKAFEAMRILEENGFVFRYVKTDGDSSNHDGLWGYQVRYADIETFLEKAKENFEQDYKETLAKPGTWCLSWDRTSFVMENAEKDLLFDIITEEYGGKNLSFCVSGVKQRNEYNRESAKEILEKLENLK